MAMAMAIEGPTVYYRSPPTEHLDMLEWLKKRPQTPSDTAPASKIVEEHSSGAPTSVPEPVDPFEVGLWDEMDSGWYRNDEDELFKGFKICPEDVVLDIGCGDGGRSVFCAQRGCHIIHSDIDPAKVDRTAQRLVGSPARVTEGVVSDTDPLPLDPETATRIIATEILEHVDSPQRFLAELARVGKPGALYLLSVPDPAGENAQIDLAAPQYFQKPNHIHVFEREEFSNLVTEAGLEVVDKSYFGFYWTIWWLCFWSTGQPQLAPPWDEVLLNWTRTWESLMRTPQGWKVKQTLNNLMPKCQVIIARKPDRM